VPEQDGTNDCGYYMLKFAQMFVENPEKCRDIIKVCNMYFCLVVNVLISRFYQSNSRKKLHDKWGNPKTMRGQLQELISGLMGKDASQ
jgi:Ulp1 family protease